MHSTDNRKTYNQCLQLMIIRPPRFNNEFRRIFTKKDKEAPSNNKVNSTRVTDWSSDHFERVRICINSWQDVDLSRGIRTLLKTLRELNCSLVEVKYALGKNVGCGEVNIINKHLKGLKNYVGCSELSVVAHRISRVKIHGIDRNSAGTFQICRL